MERHATELAELRATHQLELQNHDQALRATFNKFLGEARESSEKEKKELCEQERQFQTERHRKQCEEMQSCHKDEVRRLREEVQRERERREEERKHWVREAEQIRRIAHDRAVAEVDQVKQEMEDMKKSMERRHALEVTSIKVGY